MKSYSARWTTGLVTLFLHLSFINAEQSLYEMEIDVDHYGPFRDMLREEPCPDPMDIEPCTCNPDFKSRAVIDCSFIPDESDLKEVFSKDLDPQDFYELKIVCSNNKIERLKEGDLGNSSFESITINSCSTIEVSKAALSGSLKTLELLDLRRNRLVSPPDLSEFTSLKYLHLRENFLVKFPELKSDSLLSLNLAGNSFTTIPDDALSELPSLEEIFLMDTLITEIKTGTFADSESLHYLDFSYSSLKTIQNNSIELHGNQSYLVLSNSEISEFPTEAFSGVTGMLDVRFNSLTELEESVFRPPLEARADVYLEDNPFGCDCDIAWLVLNQTLLGRIEDIPKCADGKSFFDLDPTYYEENCD